MTLEIRFGWRSRVRILVGVLVTFVAGVMAATPDLAWPVRLVFALGFLVGAGACLDAIAFASSWRMTAEALKVPTLLSRRREIAGRDDLTVELHDALWSRIGVTGENGTRLERTNPLVSGADLRRWWNGLPD